MLRIDGCLIDIDSREVRHAGAKRARRLTPKAMAVLLALARRAGQVVSRDSLLAEVWPDTLPTNDVVTQAITQLRKALANPQGDARGRGAQIETIAKTGYRLLSDVQWDGDPAVGAQPVPDASRSSSDALPAVSGGEARPTSMLEANVRAPGVANVEFAEHKRIPQRLLWGAAAVVVLLLLICGPLLLWYRQTDGSAATASSNAIGAPQLPYRLITSGGGFDLTPTLSPDGAMVAYTSMVPERAETQILVKTTNSAAPHALTHPPAGESDRLPEWSPDGKTLAFARESGDGGCKVMIVAAGGAPDEQQVARCDRTEMLSFSWSPDGTRLLFGTMSGDNPSVGIRTLDIASGQWHSLSYGASSNGFDYAPRYSPDGRWIGFVRNPQMGDLWVMPAAGGKALPLIGESAEIRGWSWLPDSEGIVFGRRVDSQARLYRVELGSHRLHDLGLNDAQSPVVSRSQDKLAFMQRRPQFGIYRIHEDSRGTVARERIYASNGRDAQPMVSPDGRQLVFSSDRSGAYQLWWGDLGHPEQLRPVEGFVPDTRQPAAWAADSARVLVVGRDADGSSGVYEYVPALDKLRRLEVPVPRPLQAVYVEDPARLLVLSADEAGGAKLTLYDRSRQPWRMIASIDDVSQVRVDGHDLVFSRFSSPGLWQIDEDLDMASVRQLNGVAPSRWRYRAWAVGPSDRIDYLWSNGDCPTYNSVLKHGVASEAGRCLSDDSFAATNGFSIDPGGALYVALATEDGSGIGFMALPRQHSSFIGVVCKLLFGLRNVVS